MTRTKAVVFLASALAACSRSSAEGTTTQATASAASSATPPLNGRPSVARTGAQPGAPKTEESSAANAAPAVTTAAHIEHIENAVHGGTIADRMTFHHVHAISVAVIANYEIAWAKGYGLADVAGNVATTPTTLFEAGSVSKPVTATAVMKHIQDGKLALDAKVNDVLTSWKLPDNALTTASPVIIAELLSHTAGTTVHGFDGYPTGAPLPTLVQILNGTPPANSDPIRVTLAPGTEFRYSGGGYVILQQVLIDLDKETFPQIMQETVLGPMGMTLSSYEQPLPDARLANAAVAYGSDGKPYGGKRHVYPEMAPAGLWTTPSDLARWAIELSRETQGTSAKVLSQATAVKMTTRYTSPSGAPVKGDGLGGLGIFIAHRPNGAKYLMHDGVDDGFQTNVVFDPESGDGDRGDDELGQRRGALRRSDAGRRARVPLAGLRPSVTRSLNGELAPAPPSPPSPALPPQRG